MQAKIKHAVVLVEFEDGTVHQAIIKDETMRTFLMAVSSMEGTLNVVEEPIEGLILQNG